MEKPLISLGCYKTYLEVSICTNLVKEFPDMPFDERYSLAKKAVEGEGILEQKRSVLARLASQGTERAIRNHYNNLK